MNKMIQLTALFLLPVILLTGCITGGDATATPAPSIAPSVLPTPEPTIEASPTPTPTTESSAEPSATPTPTTNATATPEPTVNATATPTINATATPTPVVEMKNKTKLVFSFAGLEALDKGHFEGWIVTGDNKTSTGKFNLTDSLTFEIEGDFSASDKVVLTIEPEGDTDAVPAVPLLSGNLVNGTASLAFPMDFSSAAGNYILATPTDGANSNETSGIWFLTLPDPKTAGLTLPGLETGWTYEGWAVYNGTPLSTGRFSSVTGADGFNGYSGTTAGPAFPGEDFLQNAPTGVTFPLDLASGASKAVISVEPSFSGEDPTGDAPYQVKPLVADIPLGATNHTNYNMSLNLGSLPTGNATVTVS